MSKRVDLLTAHLFRWCEEMNLLFTALCLLSWSSVVASAQNTMDDDPPWVVEEKYIPSRILVSKVSAEKFEAYQRMTCRKSNKGDRQEYINQYLEWEEIEFNRALRDTLVNSEKDLNTDEGQEIIRAVPSTVLDTKYTSNCVPEHQVMHENVKKLTKVIDEVSNFEDDLIDRMFFFDLLQYYVEEKD
uniref:Secreted protein n=1 Tax=Steinernema glaseri TaxID=37863 RepID=A0A1I7Z5K5_9BILA